MMTLAKQLSGAYMPISAVLVTDAIYQVLADNSARRGSFGHGYTYSAHPVCAAVALETLKIYAERDIVGHVLEMAPLLQDGLRRFAGHPPVGAGGGVRLNEAGELVADNAAKPPLDPVVRARRILPARAQD